MLKMAPLSVADFAGGLATCVVYNIPYLLLALLALFPGCIAVLVSGTMSRRLGDGKKETDPLAVALWIILIILLAACLVWPAMKIRYLVPAAPLILLLAWHRLTVQATFHRGLPWLP